MQPHQGVEVKLARGRFATTGIRPATWSLINPAQARAEMHASMSIETIQCFLSSGVRKGQASHARRTIRTLAAVGSRVEDLDVQRFEPALAAWDRLRSVRNRHGGGRRLGARPAACDPRELRARRVHGHERDIDALEVSDLRDALRPTSNVSAANAASPTRAAGRQRGGPSALRSTPTGCRGSGHRRVSRWS